MIFLSLVFARQSIFLRVFNYKTSKTEIMKITPRHPGKVTPLIVLAKIIELSNKQETKKAISLDTLALIFSLKPMDIVLIIEDLEGNGNVQRHIPTTQSRRSCNIGMVTLI